MAIGHHIVRELLVKIIWMIKWNPYRKSGINCFGKITLSSVYTLDLSSTAMIDQTKRCWSLPSCLLTLFPPPPSLPLDRASVASFGCLRGNIFGLEINSAVGNRGERGRRKRKGQRHMRKRRGPQTPYFRLNLQ